MPASRGTVESIAILLGEALHPLAERMAPDRIGGLLGELGLAVPASLVSPSLQSALGAAATAATELPALVADLNASIEVDAGGIEIGVKAGALAEKAIVVIDAFETIATELGNLPPIPSVPPAEVTAFVNALPGRLLELVLVDYLERQSQTLTALLSLIGVIEKTKVNVGSTNPFLPEVTRRSLRLDRIGAFFQSPETIATDLYGWGGAGLDATKLLGRIYDLLVGLGMPVAWTSVGTPPRPALEFFLAKIAGTTGLNPPGLEATIGLALSEGFALDIPLGAGLQVEIRAHGSVGASASVRVQPPADVSVVPPSGQLDAELSTSLAKVPVAPQTVITLFGLPGGTRIEAGRISVGLKSHVEWDTASGRAQGDFGMEGRIEGGKLVISLDGADGFIGTLVGGSGLEGNFDVGFGWDAGSGVYFTGSGSLQIQLPTHVSLGPIEITGITLGIGMSGGAFEIELSATIRGALGPIAAVVENIGATADLSFPSDGSGNLGIADLAFGFKPPNGVGLSLDVGVVKGGGYLFIDTERGEYAGALELVIADFLAVTAIGLISTKNPDGTPGFSLLIVITVDFGTGIQLGYGFTLLAVGGIVGVNRTMRLQALMEGVRTGAIESVMFPQDVVANAPQILSDLRNFFPMQEGTFLVGPMLKLGWGTPTLISVSVGVIIEIPGNIAIVGILKVALPADDLAILVLQVNFAGAIEFDKKRIYFFAALFESRVLFMTIEGEMGLLVAWGDDANFVISVGGFHPRFSPPPLPFPSPQRVAISLINTSNARVRVSGYFAVTSNTAQFGAAVDIYFGFSEFSVEGHLGFDALFQFSPFYFIIDVSLSVSLKAFGVGVFSIRLEMSLEGPTPWRARGTGYLEILFFEISADFDVTWGESRDTALEPIDVFPMLVAELQKPTAWEARLPAGANLLVSLRPLEGDDLVLHPLGALNVRQRAVPLDLSIDKVGNRSARDAKRLTVQAAAASGLVKTADAEEQFAIGQFLEKSKTELLASPAFQRQHAGLELSVSGASTTSAKMVKRVVRYEEIIIDNRFRRRVRRFAGLFGVLFDHLLKGNSVALSALSAQTASLLQPFDDRVTIGADEYVVASTATNAAVAGISFASEASASDHLASMLVADPNMSGALHVIPAAEMVS